MKQINLGIIGTGWCGGIRAVAAASSPWVNELHIAEIREERLKEVAELTKPVHGHYGLPEVGRKPVHRRGDDFDHARAHPLSDREGEPAGGKARLSRKADRHGTWRRQMS